MKKLFSNYQKRVYVIGLVCVFVSCKKQDAFLDVKPNDALTVPQDLNSLQTLLNNEGVFNINDPVLQTLSADEYWIPNDEYLSLTTAIEKNAPLWLKDIYPGEVSVGDWNSPYQSIYYANTVLDALNKMSVSAEKEYLYNSIKGTALFYRAISLFNIIQLFSTPYDSLTSSKDLGVPLRLSSDLNVKTVRETQEQCYRQVISDLDSSISLLPQTSEYFTEPNKCSANALLARVQLSLGNYKEAFNYADASLKLNNTIVDFNTIPPQSYTLASSYLVEDIYHSVAYGTTITFFPFVDTVLYQSYDSTDLRKTLFFIEYNGYYRFQGSYDVLKGYQYTGLATDEMLLTRAECSVRMGKLNEGMSDLNRLLINRYKTGRFTARTASDEITALNQIILERKKELVFRNTRWLDLRRLNMDPRFAITLTRNINGQTYNLPPNDPRYAMPIPDNEISISGIKQNNR